eukprot:CAMPEP_0113673930 /NCGR_PEP_ID=MMETSP0038_2-20120614/7124_1 /TAXON_ID=2898 /ORGANISM="Cryptomonas paramecium" /LENGTH=68 /DNA_ID=CAMNT_0000590429 /DNA_START=1 /DNA_END=208 /DNA_ORIENTATION=+ /assembly_acc=CAM_ASM_000170
MVCPVQQSRLAQPEEVRRATGTSSSVVRCPVPVTARVGFGGPVPWKGADNYPRVHKWRIRGFVDRDDF